MKKKIIILLIIFLLTGCSSTYNVKLNEDSTINENVIITIDNTDDNYKKVNELLKSMDIEESDYKIDRNTDEINVNYNKDYETIDDYALNSIIYKQLFELDYTKTRSNITVSAIANLSKNNISINKDNIYNFDDIQINIDSKLPVLSYNADSIKDNVYTWNINENDKEKIINLKFKNIPLIVTIRSIILFFMLVLSVVLISLIVYRRMMSIQRI